MKIAVVGAGASGIIAALIASKHNQVYLFDGNDKCGKKILATGSGHCNYWNEDIDINKYQTDDYSNLMNIISKENQQNVLTFLDSIGIYPRIKNGYYYPYSNQATSIRQIFETAINYSNVTFLTNNKVININRINNQFIVITNNSQLVVDKVILATGSKAYPKTGSDGSGYLLIKKFGHTINPVLPALTKLITNDKTIKDWENIRADATVKVFDANKLIAQDTGEIQLAKDGISGICTFNISSYVSKALTNNPSVEVTIDFFPSIDNLSLFLEERSQKLANNSLETMLESIFNYKLLFVLLDKANLNKDRSWETLSKEERNRLVNTIKNFKIPIVATESFDKAQVCTGGISLTEINPQTMESLIVPNLYFAGEILDVDGRCGGYNLAFAFITGYLAGKAINDKS